MKRSDKLTISDQVMDRDLGNETVILDLASGAYFTVDEVGASIWKLFASGHNLGEVCDKVQADYDVSCAELEQDVVRFVDQLVAKGLAHF